MKIWLRTLVPGFLLVSLLSSGAAGAEARIGTVDLRKVFDNYWKKKQAEAALAEQKADYKKDDDDMVAEYKKLKDDYTNLEATMNDAAISIEERDRRRKAAEDKLKQMKEKEESITVYRRQTEATLGERTQRMRGNIINEIRNVVSAKAKAAGFALVIDTAADSVNLTPVILYTDNTNDLTDAVLLQLNATAPTEASKPNEKPSDKKDEKKKDAKK
jgi:outer membrane protein